MRQVKAFKHSMNTQSNKLKKLEERIRVADDDDKVDALKDEAKDIRLYLLECEKVAFNWINATDADINNLADFKYWRRT